MQGGPVFIYDEVAFHGEVVLSEGTTLWSTSFRICIQQIVDIMSTLMSLGWDYTADADTQRC